MKLQSRFCLAVLLSAAPLLPAAAQENLPVAKPVVKTLAAFKNGLGFVFKSGETSLKDGWARMDDTPGAALGSLWIGTTAKGRQVTDVISYQDKAGETNEAINLPELLAANVGRRVAVTYTVGNSSLRAEGLLTAVPADRKPDDSAPPPIVSDYSSSSWPATASARGEMVLIRTGTGTQGPLIGINKYSIQAVELLDGATLNTTIEKQHSRLKLHVGGNPASTEITLAYLEKGIVWSPSYRINIADDKNAEIALDAILANDVEDLTNTEVSFVVGFPNFLYADMLSPLAQRQSVSSFVQSLLTDRPNSANNRFANGNIMAQSVAYNSAAFDDSTRSANLYSANHPLPGEGNEDLYLYKKSGVTLKKGDRASFDVFTASVPCEHLYQWNVPDDQNVDARGYRRSSPGTANPSPEAQIWHVLRLENKTKQPWTTAPAFTVNNAMPVAQDVLGYTPPGGKSTLRLTVATELRPEASQVEQQRRSISSDGLPADEITVGGKLKVTSWKATDASVVVHKTVTGEVLDPGTGKVTKMARSVNALNPASEIEWEFQLPAGKAQELSYQYKVIVRH